MDIVKIGLSIALILVLICFLFIYFNRKKIQTLQKTINALTVLVKETDKQRDIGKKEVSELRTGVIGIGKKVVTINKAVAEQNVKIAEVSIQRGSSDSIQDLQTPIYSRATKMAELGADVDELMRECDLPKAEAELLIRFHRNR